MDMSNVIYFVSTYPEYYGSDATEEEGVSYAKIIAERASEIFPEVEFVIVDGPIAEEDYGEEEQEIQYVIAQNWADWLAEDEASE